MHKHTLNGALVAALLFSICQQPDVEAAEVKKVISKPREVIAYVPRVMLAVGVVITAVPAAVCLVSFHTLSEWRYVTPAAPPPADPNAPEAPKEEKKTPSIKESFKKFMDSRFPKKDVAPPAAKVEAPAAKAKNPVEVLEEPIEDFPAQ